MITRSRVLGFMGRGGYGIPRACLGAEMQTAPKGRLLSVDSSFRHRHAPEQLENWLDRQARSWQEQSYVTIPRGSSKAAPAIERAGML
jgi:hypothetical protein